MAFLKSPMLSNLSSHWNLKRLVDLLILNFLLTVDSTFRFLCFCIPFISLHGFRRQHASFCSLVDIFEMFYILRIF